MSEIWYYVNNGQRIGPVDKEKIQQLIEANFLDDESYVWTQGFENWERLKNVSQFELNAEAVEVTGSFNIAELELSAETKTMTLAHDSLEAATSSHLGDWDNIPNDEQVFLIKIGIDRAGPDIEYGPFSLNQLKRALNEKRINGKTLVYTKGMKNWEFLADVPIFEKISSEFPPVISDNERRVAIRKPFVARMFFHDNSVIYEGVCRDISVGGLQILISNFPGTAGDEITMNVHPDNSDYSFVAKGTIVRMLEGNQGFSLRFSDLPGEAHQAIQKYIQNN